MNYNVLADVIIKEIIRGSVNLSVGLILVAWGGFWLKWAIRKTRQNMGIKQ